MSWKRTNRLAGQGDESKGFTLIEVMVALVVLAVGLLALIQLQVAAINGLAYSRHFSVATQLAAGQLDRLMGYPFPQAEVSNENYCPKDTLGIDLKAETDDGTAVSVFYDPPLPIVGSTTEGFDTVGYGEATRLWLPTPVNERGQPARIGEPAYVVTWTVERGGSFGTITPGKMYGVPGGFQVQLAVSVLWFDKGDGYTAFTYLRPSGSQPLWSKRTTLRGMRILDPS